MAFLGIKVPSEVGRLISGLEVPGEKESPSEYHITILCFEDNWPISEISKAMETAYDVISKVEPFLVKAKEVSHFPPREGHPVPIIAPVKSEELQDLHKKLAKAFDADQINFKKTFKDFKPHITLAYSEEEPDDFKIEPAIEFMVNEAVLFGGDHGDERIFITFPLKGPARKKHATLLQKVEMFEKIASSSGPGYLTPTFERRKEERN